MKLLTLIFLFSFGIGSALAYRPIGPQVKENCRLKCIIENHDTGQVEIIDDFFRAKSCKKEAYATVEELLAAIKDCKMGPGKISITCGVYDFNTGQGGEILEDIYVDKRQCLRR